MKVISIDMIKDVLEFQLFNLEMNLRLAKFKNESEMEKKLMTQIAHLKQFIERLDSHSIDLKGMIA